MTFTKYQLPDGRIVDVDSTAAKDATTISYTLSDGSIVTATRLNRFVEWGHWGLFFYEKTPGAYAPAISHGHVYFAVGSRGPIDGGSERLIYQNMVKAWLTDGILPTVLIRRSTIR